MLNYIVTNVVNAVLIMVVFSLFFSVFDKKLFKKIDFIAELKKNNLAVAIMLSALFLSIAIVVRNV